jgi:anti-anti-sigma factor
MEYTGEKCGNILVVRSLNPLATISSALQFKNFVLRSIEEGEQKIIFDLKNIVMIDSTFLGAMVVIHRKLISIGSKLILSGANESVRLLLGLTKLNEAFDVYSTLEDAKGSFPEKCFS